MKVKISPNKEQQTALFQYAKASRYAYNWALRKEQEAHKRGANYLLAKELQEEFNCLKKVESYQWLYDIPEEILNLKIREAAYAYKNFLSGVSNCPRFKKKETGIIKFGMEKIKVSITKQYILVEELSSDTKRKEEGIHQIKLVKPEMMMDGDVYGSIYFMYKKNQWYIVLETVVNEKIGQQEKSQLLMRKYRLEKRKRRMQRSIARKYEKNKKGNTYCKTKNIIKKEKELDKLRNRLTNIQCQIKVFDKE